MTLYHLIGITLILFRSIVTKMGERKSCGSFSFSCLIEIEREKQVSSNEFNGYHSIVEAPMATLPNSLLQGSYSLLNGSFGGQLLHMMPISVLTWVADLV